MTRSRSASTEVSTGAVDRVQGLVDDFQCLLSACHVLNVDVFQHFALCRSSGGTSNGAGRVADNTAREASSDLHRTPISVLVDAFFHGGKFDGTGRARLCIHTGFTNLGVDGCCDSSDQSLTVIGSDTSSRHLHVINLDALRQTATTDLQAGELDGLAFICGRIRAGCDGDRLLVEQRIAQRVGLRVYNLVDCDGLASISADLEQLAGEPVSYTHLPSPRDS